MNSPRLRTLLLFVILTTAAFTLAFAPAPYVYAADFGMFGGSGGAGGSFPQAEGGAGSSLTAIGGAGGYANNLSGGGGGGQGGYYDGDSNVIIGGADGSGTEHVVNGGDGGGGAAAGTGNNGTPGNDATALYGGGGGGSYGDSVTGGNGGDGSTTGGGGGGGGFGSGPNNSSGGSAYVLELNMSYTGYDSVMIEGGHGGNGGLSNNTYAGGGGDGAGAKANAAALLTVNGNLTILAGGGGNGGEDSGNSTNGYGGDGGAGGSAELDASGKIVEVNGILSVTSGLNGTNGTSSSPAGRGGSGGLGGDAVFTADTLSAPAINLTQNDGALTFTITTLNVSAADTTLNLNGTTAAGVNITTVNLSNDKIFTINNTNGNATVSTLNITGTGGTLRSTDNYTIATANLSGGALFVLDNSAGYPSITNLNVSGIGQLYTTYGSRQSITTLSAAGASLTIVLPDSLQANGTALTVGDANLMGTTLGVAYQSVRPSLTVGQSFILLDATTLTTDITTITVQSANGDIYTLTVASNQILAVLDYIAPTGPAYERLKAYAEGRVASLAFVNQGHDLIINQGLSSARAATQDADLRFGGFVAMEGGSSRYNTGSHVDVDGFSMLAGIAVGNNAGPGRLTLGAFVEGGWGDYDSHNSFSNAAAVNGGGDTSYYGGGVLGRYDLPGGLYAEASARVGKADTNFDTGDILYNGSKAKYDSDSMYYGAHIGVGYTCSVTPQAGLDLSAKLLWTHQDGDSVNVHGDNVRFKNADSLRTRLGGRFTYAVNEYFTPYAGAYWEHEFDGDVRSSVNGIGIDAPDLKGDTGKGELGLNITPFENKGLSLNLGVQGYVGQREGVTGSLQLQFGF